MTNPSVHRVIAGYGRSGTTWIQDVLARSNSLRAVFEPLHPKHIVGADEYAHRYVSQSRDEPELYQLLHRFFCEDFRSLWADYRVIKKNLITRRDDLKSWHSCGNVLRRYRGFGRNFLRFNRQRRHPQRLVKLIRANLMLPWLQANFDARIVFVIRHPAAVVSSQLKSRKSWNPYKYIDRYRADPNLLENLDARTKQLLFQTIDDVEAYTLCWCIENMTALEQAKRCDISVVYYELLLQRGLPEWRRIVSALDLAQMPDQQLIEQPSQQTWGRKSSDSTLLLNFASWKDAIDDSVLARIQGVLDVTGMKVYSVDDPLPVVVNEIER